MCFIDYNKAFDCVEHSRVWNTLRNMGVPAHLITLIMSLYTMQDATLKTVYCNTEWFEVGKGVRQGCILSPYLFNMYSEYVLRRVGLAESTGINIGGRTMNNADDTTLLTEDVEDLRSVLTKLQEEREKARLMLNLKNTKITITGTLKEFIIEGTGMDITNCYTVLVFVIKRDGCNIRK
jgi:hypothetical protein